MMNVLVDTVPAAKCGDVHVNEGRRIIESIIALNNAVESNQ